MNNRLYNELRKTLEERVVLLEDKPEETYDTTLQALWHSAYGNPMSAEESIKVPLPELSDQQILILRELVEKRINNIPLAHITGFQKFMDLELRADRRALIPRKETEILGKESLEICKSISGNLNEIKVLDVCCGAGNLAVSIAHFNQKTKVFATDISDDAISLTKENIKLLKLEERVFAKKGDLLSEFSNIEYQSQFDLVVCNPPYISTAKASRMNKEIADHEPLLAFDGGSMGFNLIRKLIQDVPALLKSKGWFLFEVGLGQGEFISQMCERTGLYSTIELIKDLKGNSRVIKARK